MKIADVDILIVPGYGDSEDEHWQTRWQRRLPTARRITQADWQHADRARWVAAIVEGVAQATKPTVLVAHSIGVAAVAHAAPELPRTVAGAFLVGMSDWNRPEVLPGVPHDFAPIPRDRLPFPSMLVASRSDPYCDYDVAASYAAAWGSTLVDAGEAGHLNVASGHGPWPEGLLRFGLFLKSLA